ncbi:MAG: hypothetical protein ACK5KT_17730 [Dysgonomonas sp.]
MENKSGKTKRPWSLTTNRFVCFLDIMGFKDMVMRNSHESIYKMLNDFSKKRDTLDGAISLPKQYETDSLKTVSFSDSIVIFTKEDTKECLELLTLATSWLFAKAIEAGIPLKGAIAHGTMSINVSRQIFFGQPLIDAYLLEEEVEFYGIVIHNTTEKKLNEYATFKGIEMYKDCNVPLKSGRIQHYTLDWVTGVEGKDESIKEKSLALMKKQREQTSGRPRKYIDNTISVINQIYE